MWQRFRDTWVSGDCELKSKEGGKTQVDEMGLLCGFLASKWWASPCFNCNDTVHSPAHPLAHTLPIIVSREKKAFRCNLPLALLVIIFSRRPVLISVFNWLSSSRYINFVPRFGLSFVFITLIKHLILRRLRQIREATRAIQP